MNIENPEENTEKFSKERLNRIIGITFAVLITIGIILSISYELDLIPKEVRKPQGNIKEIFQYFNRDYVDSKKVYSAEEILKLEEKVKEINKLPNVSARAYYDIYVELGDAYKSKKQYNDAYETYMKALRLNSWDYPVQVKLAEVEIKLQKYYQAEKRLKNVTEYSKDKIVLKRAQEFMDILNTIEYSKQRIELPGMYHKRIYILQTDNVDYRFTEAIKTRIMEEFKISVVVLGDTVIPTTRNARMTQEMPCQYDAGEVLKQFIEEIKSRIKERFQISVVVPEDTVIPAVRNARIKQEMLYQYDADAILEKIRKEYDYLIKEPDNYGVLLVTSYDIYTKDYNFLFGWSGGDAAVISYNRFNRDSVSFDKQIKRFVMQSFSSVGFLIGIPRCSNPTCARAYPHSLAEQDRKEDILCDECLENLIKIYENEK